MLIFLSYLIKSQEYEWIIPTSVHLLWVEWAGEAQLQSTQEAELLEPKSSKDPAQKYIPPTASTGWGAEAIGRIAQKSDFSRFVLSPVSDHWWDMEMADKAGRS